MTSNQSFIFFKNINVWDGKAKTITTAVNLLMEKRNFDKNRMTGFGSHRACIITGKNNGVTKLMNDDSPYPISIRCTAHTLALCTSQVANRIPDLSKFKETSTAFYCYLDSALGAPNFERFFKMPS